MDMKRRNVLRNLAAGGLLASGVSSAAASNRGNGSTMYKLQGDDDTFENVETLDAGVLATEDECDGLETCCEHYCCHCQPSCDICYCRETCGDPIAE